MKKYLDKLPAEIKELLYSVQKIAARNNVRAYLVGGFVRDLFLRVSNFDLDIVVEEEGIKFAEEGGAFFGAKVIKHKRFGTATVFLKHDRKLDVATARRETYPEPASLPQVSPGTIKDDLFRRDFTINAMAVSLDGKEYGELLDLFGGRNDIARKKIRVLHDLSFIDDPTRLLRAVRFAQRYDFRIETKTMRLLKDAVRQNMLEKVSGQRIRDEVILLLKEDDPVKQIKRLQELTGLGFLSYRMRLSHENFDLLRSLKDEISWFRRLYHGRRVLDTWLVYFMGLLDNLTAVRAKAVLKKFMFKKGQEKRLLASKKISKSFIEQLSQDALPPSRIFSMLEPLSYEVIIFIKAKFRNKNIQKHIEDFLEIYNGMSIYICGDDLCAMGLKPGPCYQKIFSRVLDAKLNGLVKTREDELALIKSLINKI